MHRMRTASAALSGADRSCEGFIDGSSCLRRRQLCESRLEIENDVIGQSPAPVGLSVVLPDVAACPISLDRPTYFHRNRNPDTPRTGNRDRGRAHHGGGAPPACLQNGRELAALQNAAIFPQARAAQGHAAAGLSLGCAAQAARRCRPLARRRLITSRPPRDRMRTRKPWVLLRRRLFGWNVLFTVSVVPCEK